MKLLFDANLSPRLASAVSQIFPGSRHVSAIHSLAVDNRAIWEYAREGDFVIISKDSDFYHFSLMFGAPPKIVWLRIGNAKTETIRELISASAAIISEFVTDEQATFLVLGGREP